MKFVYHYRTSDNIEHEDVVCASDREAAYAALKARGVRPSRLWEAPGLGNRLLKWRRMLVVCGLAAVCAMLAFLLVTAERRIERRIAAESGGDAMPRHFVALEVEVDSLFEDEGSRVLARYAIPGAEVRDGGSVTADMLVASLDFAVEIGADDPQCVVELKRMVMGMKDELRQYLKNGFGTAESFLVRMEERQTMERAYREQTLWRCKAGLISKAEANTILSAMGLEPME